MNQPRLRARPPLRHYQVGMGKRKAATAVTICLLLELSALAASSGARVEVAGGTLAEVPAKASGRLLATDPQVLLIELKQRQVRIPYENVNLLEYGQNASRRYVLAMTISPMLLLSKSKKHFLTIGFKDEAGHQQALVLRVHKDDVRSLLAVLEARTGRRVEYQDVEAKKAGGG